MDVEQPTPADVQPDSTFDGIEEPLEVIENAAYINAAHQGCEAGAYYASLMALGMKPKHAYWLTSQWLEARS